MPTVKSSVFYLGNSESLHLGVESSKNWRDLFTYDYSVWVLEAKEIPENQVKSFLKEIKNAPGFLPKILVFDEAGEKTQELLSQVDFFRVLHRPDMVTLENSIIAALEKSQQEQLSEDLAGLVKSQNSELERWNKELEDRVDKRQQNLQSARKRLQQTSKRMEALHRAIVAIHRSQSIADLEIYLTEALKYALDIVKIKIDLNIVPAIANLQDTSLLEVYTCELFAGRHKIGFCHFARSAKEKFLASEKKFLEQVSEAMAIAVQRWISGEKMQRIREEWQWTFDSIPHPLVILDAHYNVILSNQAWRENPIEAKGRCFQQLLGRTVPCEGCELGKIYQVEDWNEPKKIYQVISQKLDSYFVNIYYDVSKKERLKKQILESSKLADMGLVGSSIAHELNNPLAGILTFLQLIRMDLKGDEVYAQDIIDMESGAKRCRDMIQNLLSFTRSPSIEAYEEFALVAAVESAMRILDVKAKSLGIEIHLENSLGGQKIYSNKNLLSQAIVGILKNSIEELEEAQRLQTSFVGSIYIKLTNLDSEFTIDIRDNGRGIVRENLPRVFTPFFTTKDPNLHRGLGLTTSYQIVTDLKGDLEIFSSSSTGVQARIVLPEKIST